MARSLLSDGRCGAPGPELQRLPDPDGKILRKSSLWACLSCNIQDGLQHLDGGRFLATEKSGNVWMGSSAVRQGFLETSNTDLATEIGKVIEAQRS